MKNLLFAILMMMVSYGLIAGNPDNPKLKINENSYSKLSFTSTLVKEDMLFMKVKTVLGVFAQMGITDYGYSVEQGEPRLPVMKKLIEVPIGAGIEIHIIKAVTKDYTLQELGIPFQLMPTQRSISKSEDPKLVPFQYDEQAYKTNSFLEHDIVKVENIGIMRGVRIGRLEIAPVQYNPVAGTIRVITELEAEVVFTNADVAATEKLKSDKYSPYFESTYSNLLNYKPTSNKDALSKYPVKYVIISDPMFQSAIQPFVQWKTKKGFTVVEGYTNNPLVGNTTTSIKNYIQGLYNAGTPSDPAPTFILFVGDVAEVPSNSCGGGSHVSDLYYCEYTGDFIPEIYYGRFSAETVADLQPQIDKTLEYEQYTMPNNDFLGEVVMVAGVDAGNAPTYGNGQINYGTDTYFNLSNNLTSHTYLYPLSDSSSSPANIINNVSNGVCFANYTAHGASGGWANPPFSVSDVATLNNAHKYPLMVGNCCLTNKFDDPVCFGEALLRAANKGAVGYIGATNVSYWDEDYFWGVGYRTSIQVNPVYDVNTLGAYDGTFHTHGEPFSKWYMTMDQMIYAGNLAVTQSGSSMIQYYWEIYNLMGDPSLMIYFGVPPAVTATFNPLIPLGASSFPIQTDPHAYAAVSMNGVLYGAAIADSLGNVSVPLTGLTTPGLADVVITRQNRAPYIGTVAVSNPTGPYVLYKSNIVNDSSGNNNGLVDYSENIRLNVTLHNYGQATANPVSATLSSANSFITITDNSDNWGSISSGSDAYRNDAYSFTVANNVPDQTNVPFTISIQDTSGGSWSSIFNIVVNAPVLAAGNLSVDDAGGNNNGCLDKGETDNIIITTFNNGHADALNTTGTLTTTSPYVTINTGTYNFNTLIKSTNVNALFNLTVASNAPDTSTIELIYTVVSGAYSCVYHFILPLGAVIEDWETNGFTHLDWQQGGDMPWIIIDSTPHQGIYCARSGYIVDNQTSTLSVTLGVMTSDTISFWKKVSSEQDYDFLSFLIDGTIKDQWSGEVPWSRNSYLVSSGQHTFMWKYAKDESVGSGSDCAWLDYISFPPVILSFQGIEENKNADNFSCNPNPASDMALVTFTLTKPGSVQLKLIDIMGKEIANLIQSQEKAAGTYNLLINVAPYRQGLYYLVLTTGDRVKTKKIVITK